MKLRDTRVTPRYIANIFFSFHIVCGVLLRRGHGSYVSMPPSTCSTWPVM